MSTTFIVSFMAVVGVFSFGVVLVYAILMKTQKSCDEASRLVFEETPPSE